MPRIRRLPQDLVNRIAAGECVERPASVVKELVENALDAGATHISVQIEDGGRERIAVTDDGCGMDAEDLSLCIEPHATSKVLADDDLFDIRTLGFRGEALPSIASVSRTRITSRPADQEVGLTIAIEGGQLVGPTPVQAPAGTTVDVRDLFYNVPARRKFLRATQTEMSQIGEAFTRLALAAPHAALSLRHGRRLVHELRPAEGPRERIAALFDRDLAAALLTVERESGGVRVTGLVCPPAESRGSAKWEYVFVNGRFVRDRFVSHAVREAYRGLIDPSRYPVTFLFITIDPQQIDVNVHPTKTEVRWRDSNFVHGQVLAALRDRFLTTRLDARLRAPATEDEHRQRVRQAMVEFFSNRQPGERTVQGDWPSDAGISSEPASQPFGSWAGPGPKSIPAQYQPGPLAPAAQVTASEARFEAHSEPEPGTTPRLIGRTRALQVHNSYLVVETDDGLMIVDQHALHERVLYEQLRQRVLAKPLESQRLLLPDVVPVRAEQISALEQHAETLSQLGIELAPSGPHSLALYAFPTFLERVDRPAFLRDLLDLLSEQGARPEKDTLLHALLDMLACKAAVKAGDPLTADEISALLEQRSLIDRSSNCPHGRPTTLRLTLRDLEKQFKRR